MASRIILPAALLFLAAGCSGPSTARLDANKDLVRRLVEAGNAADWAALEEIVADDFVRHSAATPGPEVTSRDAFIRLQEEFIATAPDQTITVRDMIAEGDRVAVLATYSGTQTGPMDPFPATGRSFEVPFLALFRIEEGRIAELWVEWDMVNMLSQLGLFPPPAPAGG